MGGGRRKKERKKDRQTVRFKLKEIERSVCNNQIKCTSFNRRKIARSI